VAPVESCCVAIGGILMLFDKKVRKTIEFIVAMAQVAGIQMKLMIVDSKL
jgi:hypothetical protein